MNKHTVGVWINNAHYCYFSNISGVGIDTVVKVTNSTNITVKEVSHNTPNSLAVKEVSHNTPGRFTVLSTSITRVIYSV